MTNQPTRPVRNKHLTNTYNSVYKDFNIIISRHKSLIGSIFYLWKLSYQKDYEREFAVSKNQCLKEAKKYIDEVTNEQPNK